jgi:lysophospholipid acyltransferase (LPLAT)-like uncharacterized protein
VITEKLKDWTRRLRRWLLPRLFVHIAEKVILRLIMKTCKVTVIGLDHFLDTASKDPCILMFWHNRLTLGAEVVSLYGSAFRYAAVISNSRDGELLAAVVDSHAPLIRTVRVAHNARSQALREIIQSLKVERTILLVTPDGPRGPRYEVKAGSIVAAKAASAQIVPMSWAASRFWQLNTWDRILLPKPFSNIVIAFGSPIKVDRDTQDGQQHIQDALNQLTTKACQTVTPNQRQWPD